MEPWGTPHLISMHLDLLITVQQTVVPVCQIGFKTVKQYAVMECNVVNYAECSSDIY